MRWGEEGCIIKETVKDTPEEESGFKQTGPNATEKLGACCTCTNTTRGHTGAARLLGRKCLLGKGEPNRQHVFT